MFFALEVVLGGFGGEIFVMPTVIGVLASTLFTSWVSGLPPHYPAPTGARTWALSPFVYAGAAILAALASISYVNLLPGMHALWLRRCCPEGQASTGRPAARPDPTSIGAGFVGGLIGPALLIGSRPGAAYGMSWFRSFRVSSFTAGPAYGRHGGHTGATFHAPLFGTMMVFEMVGDVRFLVPPTLGAALAYAIARLFQPGSAYTLGFPAAGVSFVPGTFVEHGRAQEPPRL